MNRAILSIILLLSFFACRPNSGSVLDDARFPSHEGVVTKIDFKSVTLDGDTTFEIPEDVQSFTSAGHKVTALLTWKDRYVHVGSDNGRARWIAGIGIVRKVDAVVTYAGEFVAIQKGRAVFKDGTTLKLAKGIKTPRPGELVVTFIDSKSDEVTEIRSQSSN